MADRHTSYLSAAGTVVAHRRRRPAVTAAFVAGALLGGTGLAAALPGPLPTQASSVATSAINAVNPVDHHGHAPTAEQKAQAAAARAAAKAARLAASGGGVERFTQGCLPMPTTPYNHGQYVKAHPDDPLTADKNERQMAAESDCGKPVQAVTNQANAGSDDEKAEHDDENAKPDDAGKPAHPGKSDDEHPSTTARGRSAEHHSTDDDGSHDHGHSDEHRPDDVGPPTSTGS